MAANVHFAMKDQQVSPLPSFTSFGKMPWRSCGGALDQHRSCGANLSHSLFFSTDHDLELDLAQAPSRKTLLGPRPDNTVIMNFSAPRDIAGAETEHQKFEGFGSSPSPSLLSISPLHSGGLSVWSVSHGQGSPIVPPLSPRGSTIGARSLSTGNQPGAVASGESPKTNGFQLHPSGASAALASFFSLALPSFKKQH